MKYKCPVIVVDDMQRARHFYEDVLGQEVILDFGDNITFGGDFSLQTKSTWADFIDKNQADIVSTAHNFELYFEEEQFDAYVEKLKSISVQQVHDVKEFPWGQRVIRFYDPDMHIIEVGESMECVVKRFVAQGLTIEETAERTQHPVNFVKSCLTK